MPPPDSIDTRGPFLISDMMTVDERLHQLADLSEQATRDPLVRELASRARSLAGEDPTPYELARAALRVAQRAGYQRDMPGEWFQPVRYTVVHGGDCEDLASLYVALAWILGLSAKLLWLSQPDKPLDHVCAQVQIGRQWMWADASVCGARVGESPYAAMDRLGQWYVVEATQPGGSCSPFE